MGIFTLSLIEVCPYAAWGDLRTGPSEEIFKALISQRATAIFAVLADAEFSQLAASTSTARRLPVMKEAGNRTTLLRIDTALASVKQPAGQAPRALSPDNPGWDIRPGAIGGAPTFLSLTG